MQISNPEKNGCAADTKGPCRTPEHGTLQPLSAQQTLEEVCCGSPPGTPSSHFEKPGYQLLNFVAGFIDTPIGPVPRVKTRLDPSDLRGAVAVRLGVGRDQYKIAPGLYAAGKPAQDSPVLVTANYKLSFDMLRRELANLDAWILVLDTQGINVWCAAGKKLFSTTEVVRRIAQSSLDQVVRHHRLILPQLAATGVSARRVKEQCGFKVRWGPIRAQDLPRFISDGMKADPQMRRVTFSILERLVLIPVEMSHIPRPAFWISLALLALSGIGAGLFSLHDAWNRGVMALSAVAGGVLAGAAVAPVLLPWIPGRAFALKGMLVGVVAGLAVTAIFKSHLIWIEAIALLLMSMVTSSYLAMNFTGSTPFTSPSGVEKEMRRAIPLQAAAALIALAAWVGASFAG